MIKVVFWIKIQSLKVQLNLKAIMELLIFCTFQGVADLIYFEIFGWFAIKTIFI